MFKVWNLEYSKNTVLSIALAILVFLPFYFLFGNTLNIWFALTVVGMPHFIIGALGYLASDTRKVIGPFVGAALLGVLISIIFYRFLPTNLFYLAFLVYFVWHLLTDEQMFEATIVKGGYKIWQNSWPVVLSWGSIALVILALTISAFYHLNVSNPKIITTLWVIFVVLLGTLVYSFLKERQKGKNIPYGYLFFFTCLLVPGALIFGVFWQGNLYTPPIFIALYHFIAWYVFYTKRLAKFPKNDASLGIEGVIFGWRKNVKQFWSFVLILQTVWIILLILYLYTPASSVASYLVSPFWAPFWTILHVTTSFLPNKPIEVKIPLPNFPKLFSRFQLREILPVKE